MPILSTILTLGTETISPPPTETQVPSNDEHQVQSNDEHQVQSLPIQIDNEITTQLIQVDNEITTPIEIDSSTMFVQVPFKVLTSTPPSIETDNDNDVTLLTCTESVKSTYCSGTKKRTWSSASDSSSSSDDALEKPNLNKSILITANRLVRQLKRMHTSLPQPDELTRTAIMEWLQPACKKTKMVSTRISFEIYCINLYFFV